MSAATIPFPEALGELPKSERSDIRRMIDRLTRVPFGSAVLHAVIRVWIPYTGSLGARIEEVREGYARVTLRDRRAVRNHLDCVHAVALANLAELAGNIAIAYSMPKEGRFIVAGLSMTYLKKARGVITATSEPPVLRDVSKREIPIEVFMRDASGEVVATCTLRTLIGPKKR